MMSRSTIIALTASVLFGQTSAQLSGLSSSCQSAATSLIASPFSSCANLVGLVSVATTSGSLISPLNSWISGVCTQDPCSASTISSAESTIQSGCSSDISSGQALAVGVNTIIENYSGVRDLVCQQYASNGTYCLTSLLTAVQDSSGTQLTIGQVTSILTGGGLSQLISEVPASAVCTDCGHAIVIKAEALANNISSSSTTSSTISSDATKVCGSSFSSSAVPSTIKGAAVSAASGSSSTTPSSGASHAFNLPLVAIGGSMLAAIGGAALLF